MRYGFNEQHRKTSLISAILFRMKDLSNTLKNVLPFVIMLAVISPFVLINDLFFPFITGKAFYFRIIVEIATLLYIVLAAVDREYRPRLSPIMASAGIFLIVLGLATVSAVDPLKAFWSNYERMEGYVLFLHLFAYLVVAGSVMKHKSGWWTWFFNATLLMSIVVGADAFISFYSDPNHSGYRIFGNLGNSSYLGVYSLVHIFIALFFILKKIGHRSAKALAAQGSYVSIGFYALVAIFNLIVLFNTGTRGSFFGLVSGIFVSSALIAAFEKQHSSLRKVGIVLVSVSIAFVAFLGLFKDASFIKNSGMINRFAELVTFDVKGVLDNQGSARKMLWGMAWEGVKERPVLGWGLDNFHYVFAEKYNPAMYAQEQWFDRSHNVFMDWMVSAGILGLLAYLSLFGFAIFMVLRISEQRMSFSLKAILIGGFVAYLGHNAFIFDNLSSYILFFSTLAFIHASYLHDKEEKEAIAAKGAYGGAQGSITGGHRPQPHQHSQKRTTQYPGLQPSVVAGVAVVTTIVMFWVCYQVNMKPWSANQTLLDGLRPQILDAKGKAVTQTADAKFAKVKQAYEMRVMSNSEPLEQLAEKAAEVLASNASNEAKSAAFQYVDRAFSEQFARTPKDPRPYYFYVTLLTRSGLNDRAYEIIQKAVALSPRKQSFLAMQFIIEMQLGKKTEAYNTALKSYTLEPRNEEARRFYVASLVLVGKAKEAEAMATTTESRIKYLTDPATLNAYLGSGQQARVIALLQKEIAANQTSVDLRSTLINIYIKLGDKASAIREMKALRVSNPSLESQIDKAIEGLQAK